MNHPTTDSSPPENGCDFAQIFRLCGLLFATFLSATDATSQDDLLTEVDQIIRASDQQAQPMEEFGFMQLEHPDGFVNKLSRDDVGGTDASLQVLGMTRNDDVTLVHSTTGDRGVVETDTNLGLRLLVSQTAPVDYSGSSTVQQWSLMTVGGEGETAIAEFDHLSEALVLTGSFFTGVQDRILGGRIRKMLGVRYSYVGDDIDVGDDRILIEDFFATDNHGLHVEGLVDGQWEWKRLLFHTSLSGGFGGSHTRDRDIGRGYEVGEFEDSELNVSLVSEATGNAMLRITDHTAAHFGVHGWVMTGTKQARTVLATLDNTAAVDTDTVRLLGLTMGLTHQF